MSALSQESIIVGSSILDSNSTRRWKKKIERKINVFNRQQKFQIDIDSLRDFLGEMAGDLSPGAAFTVVLVSDRAIEHYNRKFRGKDQPTDVISFRYNDDPCDEEEYLGDIVISAETAERQQQSTLMDELKVLSLHGLLHLLGYDHETDRGEMDHLERKLRRKFRLP